MRSGASVNLRLLSTRSRPSAMHKGNCLGQRGELKPKDSASCARLGRLSTSTVAYGLLFIGFLPLVFLITLGIERVTDSNGLGVVPAAALMCATIWAGAHFIFFRCPNCGRRFHLTAALRLTNGHGCPHCGLERYQAD
jgi:predicted RNA-binding Zn-ribbon protein involved in translation (DUF1610 family)